jgi:hypothetical protein
MSEVAPGVAGHGDSFQARNFTSELIHLVGVDRTDGVRTSIDDHRSQVFDHAGQAVAGL